MPILDAETTEFPNNLLEGFAAGSDEERRWWVVYTKARQEKALARHLVGHQVPFYLPLLAHDRLVRRRRVKSYLPLFTGYMFLYGSDDERVQALTSNRISRILPVTDEQRLYDDLQQVRQAIQSGAPLSVESRLEPGRRVRVKSGSLSGMEGKVIQRRGVQRLLIAVTYLQQGVSLEIDDFMVEPI